MAEPNWGDFFPEGPKPPDSKRPRRKKAKPPAAPKVEAPIDVTDDMISPIDEETVEVTDDKDILEAKEVDEDEEDAGVKPGEESISAEDAEAAVAGAERAKALQKLQVEQKQEAVDKVIEFDEQIRKKEAEMHKKLEELGARTDSDVAGRQKKIFTDVYNREIKELKEMSGKLRERHGITVEEVAPEDIEEIAETDADRQAKEKASLNKQLAEAEAAIKALPRDRHSQLLKDRYEAFSMKGATSGWERAKMSLWRFGMNKTDKEFLKQYEELQNKKVETLKALSDFNATAEEAMRMRLARGRSSDAAAKKTRPGKGLTSK